MEQQPLKVTQETLDAIRNDDQLTMKIAEALNLKFMSVRRWMISGDQKQLTAPAVLDIISKHLNRRLDAITWTPKQSNTAQA